MSRSVKPDYDKPIQLFKQSATIRLNDEQLFDQMARTDPAYERKSEAHTISPTNLDWAKYHRAKSGLLALQNYEGTWGLSEVDIEMPRPRTEHRYTETNEEWIERCHQIVQAERKAA